ncbi:MAG: sigma-54-dependent Fis family transcriptional regulator, partial [Deltaproteobacteria bacterium]|nr:sigma-54-dependent Fis family transcriptional regulator [Deltaproteobacteria bacterium]
LRNQVASRKFRSDLYYRLAVVEVRLPPLRERISDLPLLVEHIVRTMAGLDTDSARAMLSPGFLINLARHDWPGNIRELRNHLERCAALREFTPPPSKTTASSLATPEDAAGSGRPLREARDECVNDFEKRYLDALLRVNDHRVSVAASSAGVHRIHFYRLLWKHGLRVRESAVRDDEAL